MNVDDLRNPFIVASYQGPDTTTDHNGYTKGGLLYVSHYRRGLVIFDASIPRNCGDRDFDTFLAPAANSAGIRWRLGRLSVLPVGHGRHQRHQQRAVRPARPCGELRKARARSATSARAPRRGERRTAA